MLKVLTIIQYGMLFPDILNEHDIVKMHDNELDIDDSLVRGLLQTQCPDWGTLPLEKINSSGTENTLFRLGSKYVVRLPRILSATQSIDKECEWVPKLAQYLTIPLSEPIFKGSASVTYPWVWTVTKWREGENPAFEAAKEYETFAKELALFLNKFHGITLPNGPNSRRGVPLKNLDGETRKAIAALVGEIDIQSVISLWEKVITVSSWSRSPVWVHGDLLPGNILVRQNRLSAMIDFSDVGMGDPACDLVIAWSLFNTESREIFRKNLDHIDDSTWARGRGWALSIALIMLPYYKYSNPVMARLARRMIHQVCC